jgi:hypothetical protein
MQKKRRKGGQPTRQQLSIIIINIKKVNIKDKNK